MKRFIVLLSIAAICIGSVIAIILGRDTTASTSTVKAAEQPPRNNLVDSSNIINGETNPERIPDDVAYSLLLDLIAERRTEVEQNRIRAYLRQIGLGNTDSNALIAVANEYSQSVQVLGQQAAAIKDRSHPNHVPLTVEERNQLRQLNQQRRIIAQNTIALLARRLSASGVAKVRQHIDGRVKRKTKMSADVETN